MLSIDSYRERLLHRLRAVCAVDCREMVSRECRDACGASRVAVSALTPYTPHHVVTASDAPTTPIPYLPHDYYDASLCAEGSKHQVISCRCAHLSS